MVTSLPSADDTKQTVHEKILESLEHVEYLPKIKKLLKEKYGLDAFQYRDPYFLRRISMLSKKLNTIDLFKIYSHIEASHQGYIDFLNTLTIHVTEFFRDKSLWDYLLNEYFPALFTDETFSKFTPYHPFRVWSAGCSSGQEPYSLAITLLEAYEHYLKKTAHFSGSILENPTKVPFIVHATDISQKIIEQAKEGRFDEKSLKNASKQVIAKYFLKEKKPNGTDEYLIRAEVKDLVQFGKLDLFQDTYPKNLNLVTCRNVVIYFTKDQQRILFKKFWDQLTPDGTMIIGKSELLPPEISKYFKLVKITEHVYVKKEPIAEKRE